MYCRNCGKEVAQQAIVCVSCGCAPSSGRNFCQNCGKPTDPTAEVCVKCGVSHTLADFSKGEGDIGTNYSFTVQALEVEVDMETGVVKCTDNNVMAHDCGFPLNPPAVETQCQGGAYHQGIAAALYEEFKMDRGQTLNPNLIDYTRPRAYEAPMSKVLHVVTNDPFGPFGAKEASEGSTCSAPPALINAIYNATGVWIKDLPTQPEKVFWALKAQKGRR